GRVVDDQTLQPIASAQVFVGDLGLGVLTRGDGSYLLIDVPAGTHTLEVQRIGYRTVSRAVTVVSGQSQVVDFSLAREALALDEIVVTGTAGQARRREIGN